MSEAIAFFAGLFAMAVVWFVDDTSPYARGYAEGYKDAEEKYKRREEEQDERH